MSKITVEQFKLAGFEFVVNDVVDGEELNVINAHVLNNSDIFADKTIDKLVPRQNTGAQPSLEHLESQMGKSVIDKALQPTGVEWVNGDECVYEGELFYYVAAHPKKVLDIIYNNDRGLFEVAFNLISKKLTAEQLAAKEREDAIEEMVKIYLGTCGNAASSNIYGPIGRLYDAGYRK